MRAFAALAILSLLPGVCLAGNKLTFDDRVELTRGLMAEYGVLKQGLPHAKSALAFWPMLTSAVILMAESGTRRSAGPERPDVPGPDVSGMWTTGPEGGHSP